MTIPARIYLDNAATSWPKPEAVYQAVDRYQRASGAAAGRGVYREAVEAGAIVTAARRGLARLIGASSPERIVFTANGTDALNLALHGLLRSGDHVVTTEAEHNSVLRPLRTLEDAGRITVSVVKCDGTGRVDADAIRAALAKPTRLVAITHASNVTGAIQPVAEIGKLAHQHGALVLLDAAQTLGDLPIDVNLLGVDLLAAPGHKGLLGPLGSGLLYVGPGIEEQLASVRQGGTGTASQSDRQPTTLPDKYEAGNLNVPSIVGLAAGVEYLQGRGLADVRRHMLEMTGNLIEGFREIPGLRIYGPVQGQARTGIVSITVDGYDPQEVAILLDNAYRVQVRPGLHCAPLAHARLGTANRGGTVRFSIGPFTTAGEIDSAIAAVQGIASASLDV
jgi:cysteine desulfurase/selenocysteine lyase